MEHALQHWLARLISGPSRLWIWATAQVARRNQQLKNRYGPRYTKAMVVTALIAFFVPIPGSTLLAVAVVVALAEVHRAISQRGSLPVPQLADEEVGPLAIDRRIALVVPVLLLKKHEIQAQPSFWENCHENPCTAWASSGSGNVGRRGRP